MEWVLIGLAGEKIVYNYTKTYIEAKAVAGYGINTLK